MIRPILTIALAAAAWTPSSAAEPCDQTYGPRPIHPDNWVEPSDYPAAATMAGKAGLTRFALDIDASGKPYRCGIVRSSGADVLDNKACEIMLRRGRFVPAKDKDGQPLPSHWSNDVNWRMFGAAEQVPVADLDLTMKTPSAGKARALFTVVQTVGASGAIERCQIIYPSKVAAIDTQACTLAEALQSQGPITDAQDHPVRGIRVARVSVAPEDTTR